MALRSLLQLPGLAALLAVAAASCSGSSTPPSGACTVEGAIECRGDLVATCVRTGGNLAWDAPVACGGGRACRDGACVVPECEDACPLAGQSECADGGIRICGDADGDGCLEWDGPLDCPGGTACTDGRCAGTCVPTCVTVGEKACREGGLAECTDAGDGCPRWGGAAPCPGGGTCVVDHCEDACVPECAIAGQKACVAGGVATCKDAGGGCLVLSAPVACPSGQACQGGACAAPCAGGCTGAGARLCKGDAVSTCGDPDGDGCLTWDDPVPCGEGETCSGGVCSAQCADECTSLLAMACQGNSVVTCADDDLDGCLEWTSAWPCAEGETCSAGACGAACQDECTAEGALACQAGALLAFCTDSNQDGCLDWGYAVPCEFWETCSGGVCGTTCTPECTVAGAAKCAGNAVVECGEYDGDDCLEWGTPVACPAGQVCSNGACAATCTSECSAAGARACEGAAVVTCGDYGGKGCLVWGTPVPCGTGKSCSNGACLVGCQDECTADGATRCSGATVQACGDANGDGCLEWGTGVPCANGLVCSSGACVTVCEDECATQGTTRCEPGGVATCADADADGCLEWGAAIACGAGTTCSNGTCSPTCADECAAEGALECVDGGVAACGKYDDDACLDRGTVVACAKGDVCSEGACVPLDLESCGTLGAVRCASATSTVRCRDMDGQGTLGWGAPETCGEGYACVENGCAPACAPCLGTTAATAIPAAAGQGAATGSLAAEGASLWFSFEVAKDRYYRVTVRRATGSGVSADLLQSDGKTVVASASASGSDRVAIETFSRYAGLLYVRAGAWPSSAGLAFEATIEDLGPNDLGNDAASAPTVAADGAVVDAKAEIAKAVDWIRFDTLKGRYYRLSVSAVAATCTSKGMLLELYRTDGKTLSAATSSSNYGGELSFLAGADEPRYVRTGPAGGCAGPYTLKVEDLGPNDLGDDAATALAIAADGEPRAAKAEIPTSVDWFRLDAIQWHYYTVAVSKLDGACTYPGMFLDVYKTDGKTVSSATSSSYLGASASFLAWADEPRFARTGPSGGCTGGYTIAISDHGANDHGVDAATATPVAADGLPVAATAEIAKAQDWFRFETKKGRYYRISVSKLATDAGYPGMSLEVFKTDGKTLAQSTSSSYDGVTTTIQAGADEPRYVRCGPTEWSAGKYTVTIEDLGTTPPT